MPTEIITVTLTVDTGPRPHDVKGETWTLADVWDVVRFELGVGDLSQSDLDYGLGTRVIAAKAEFADVTVQQ